MSIRVLQSKSEISQARRELRRRGLSCTSLWQSQLLRRIAHKLGWTNQVNVGDGIKSWDILNTAEFIQQNVPRDSAILDLGAYASEILGVLDHLQYASLIGIDLDPGIYRMPYAKAIRYLVSDLKATPFKSDSFDAITAISVIEHGFQPRMLLEEIARLLRPGGYFIASFDYWPQKIDTTGIEIFGMDWTIFSKEDVADLLEQAQEYALKPVGPSSFQANIPTMFWGGMRYTFAWLALQKIMRSE